jgi:hypothetical protein
MTKDTVRYFHINPNEHYIISHGVPFSRFYACYKDVISNMLLIRHGYEKALFHRRSCFNYVTTEGIGGLLNNNIARYGDFCWVDYQGVRTLELLSGQEIAELLYFGHMGKPLESPFLSCLDNKFAYWGHNDGLYSKIFYRELRDAVPLLSATIEELFGYPKKGTHLNTLTLGGYLTSIAEKGILMDAGRVRRSAGLLTLPVYIEDISDNISNILNNKKLCFTESNHFYDINYDTKLNILKLESAVSV